MGDIDRNWKSKLFDKLDDMKTDISALETTVKVQAVYIKIQWAVLVFIAVTVGGFVIKEVLNASFNQNNERSVPIHKEGAPRNP